MTMTDPIQVSIPVGQAPSDVGLMQLRFLSFSMDMSDDDMRALAEKAIAIKKTYIDWQAFYDDLALRKKRLLGFQAIVLAMDVTAAAQAMNTTPQLVAGVMQGYAAQEAARVAELDALYAAGQLPDKPVLTDPSKDVVGGTDVTPGNTGSNP